MRRPVLVAGRSGQLAHALGRLRTPDLDFVAVGRAELDLSCIDGLADRIEAVVRRVRPVAVVNAAAYTAVDRAEVEEDAAFALNCDAAGALAASAVRHGLPIVHISTDYVFSGDRGRSYVETDATAPLNVYGRSKLAGEAAVALAQPDHAILRTAWLFGPHGRNFLTTMLELAAAAGPVRVVADRWGTPTHVPDLAEAVAIAVRGLLAEPSEERLRGVFHVVAEGRTNWAGFAEEIFRRSAAGGGPSATVEPIAAAERPAPAPRPFDTTLCCRRFEESYGHALPPWQDGVARCVDALRR